MSVNLTPADVLPDVRRTLPMFDHLPDDAPDVVDACARLAALYNVTDAGDAAAETERAHAAGLMTMRLPDARAFDGRRGGGVPAFSAVPDAWRGEHTVKRGRNRKGATSKVLARGDAPVVGRLDTDCDGRPLLAAPSLVSDVLDWSWCAARMLVMAADAPDMLDGRPNPDHLRKHRAGFSAIGVTRLADAASALDEQMPRLIGTDAEAWATVVPGDRSSRSPVAAQRSDLSGLAHHPTLSRFVAPEGGYGTHTDKLDWRPRYRLSYRARKSDPGAPTTVRGVKIGRTTTTAETVTVPWRKHEIRHAYIGRLTVMFPATFHTVTRFITAGDGPAVRTVAADGHIAVRSGAADRLHVGRQTIARTARVDRDRNGTPVKRGATAARTVGTVDAPSTVDGWTELVAMLNRGERVICHTAAGNVTVTRGKGGQYAATDKRDGREQTIRGLRTVAGVAARLAD